MEELVSVTTKPGVGSAIAGVHGLRFFAYRGHAGFASIEADWLRLTRSLPGRRFYQLPGWYRSYLCHLEPQPDCIWFIVAYRDDSPIGIFPLRQTLRRASIFSLRVLETVIHPHLKLADFVFSQVPANHGLVKALVAWLRRQTEIVWDAIYLEHVPQRSAIAFALDCAPPSMVLNSFDEYSGFIACDRSYDEATGAVSGSFKRNLRRLARRAEETAPLTWLAYRRPEEMDDALERFLGVEASGWKGSEGTGSAIRCNAAACGFYRSLVSEFGADGLCAINILCHGNRDVAGQLCVLVDGVLSILKIGYSEAHASFAPGNLMMERTIQHACGDDALRLVSFVTLPPWSHLWKPDVEAIETHTVFNSSRRGVAYFVLARLKHAWERLRYRVAASAPGAGNVATTPEP
jgi:CelD/BcsL family acetyltransferase involved in cellulose biosynthesis